MKRSFNDEVQQVSGRMINLQKSALSTIAEDNAPSVKADNTCIEVLQLSVIK